jgi:hypothetical protein
MRRAWARIRLGTDADIVVGEGCVGNGSLDDGHVARKTTPAGTHRAEGRAHPIGRAGLLRNTGCGARVARQALGFVKSSSFLGVAVRIVASQAVQVPGALGITPAPCHVCGGKADREGIAPPNLLPQWSMTLTAQADDLLASTAAGLRDCHVGELECDRCEVISAWSMTTFATNSSIGRFRACPFTR